MNFIPIFEPGLKFKSIVLWVNNLVTGQNLKYKCVEFYFKVPIDLFIFKMRSNNIWLQTVNIIAFFKFVHLNAEEKEKLKKFICLIGWKKIDIYKLFSFVCKRFEQLLSNRRLRADTIDWNAIAKKIDKNYVWKMR